MQRLLTLLVVVCAAASARAHDFWLEPSTFRPAAGQTVAIKLLVGENLAGERLPRRPQRFLRFVAVMQGSEVPVSGSAGSDPAGSYVASGEGLTRIIYESRPSPVTLSADKFEAYLREEGLEEISRIRASNGETRKPGLEIFSRSSKMLIGSGDDRPTNLPLEIVAETSGPGPRTFQVLFENKPVVGGLVTAMHRNGTRLQARTDSSGQVRLNVSERGMWLLKTVHMIAAPEVSGADWHSLWASLTFEN